MEAALEILKEGLVGSAGTILRIALFLIPIMVVTEIARHYNIIEMLAQKLKACLTF